MQVVDAVEVHVLSVPGKRGLPHPKIQIWSIDTLNNDTTLLLHHIQQRVEMANVPLLNVLDRITCIFMISQYRVVCTLHSKWSSRSINGCTSRWCFSATKMTGSPSFSRYWSYTMWCRNLSFWYWQQVIKSTIFKAAYIKDIVLKFKIIHLSIYLKYTSL